MSIAVFDVEADNFIEKMTKIHVIVVKDIQTGKHHEFTDVSKAVAFLDGFDRIVGHNCIVFDIPAIQKFIDWKPKASPIDTLIISRLLYPDRTQHPAGGSSLKNWGDYLRMPKIEFTNFESYTPEMAKYCRQDVDITEAIFRLLTPAAIRHNGAVSIELNVASIISAQIRNGFGFDRMAASGLMADLTMRKATVTEELQRLFPPKEIPLKTKVKVIPFNPGSRDMISAALIKKYKWKPTKMTETGKPQIDESILSELPFPEAPLLNEYLLVDKRISQLSQWLDADVDGRIHGDVNTNGAISGRMTHSNPNMAQVPRCGSPYGKECRALFGPTRSGWVQVGADASGLELRMFAHYLAEFDYGDYVKIVTTGDVHTHNQHAAGLKTRDQAKTFIYGLLYGAGDEKVGKIVDGSRADGERLKTDFKRKVPAYDKLLKKLQYTTLKNNELVGLDGRPLPIRSAHSALNLLLQSAGAVVMKKALIIMKKKLDDSQVQFAFMANVHDEVQIECPPECADKIGAIMVDSIKESGVELGLKCPLAGEFKVGTNWSETH